MSCSSTFLLDCTVIEATSAHVLAAYRDLKRDMNPAFVHVFLDKIQRYAQKPDRALFLVEYQNSIIAFATIIDKAPFPDELTMEQSIPLVGYSCGTGLMVLPEFRKKGVASLLVNQWELWSRKNKRQGVWIVTKKMGKWYRRNFNYLQVGMIERKGVKKIVLQKPLALK